MVVEGIRFLAARLWGSGGSKGVSRGARIARTWNFGLAGLKTSFAFGLMLFATGCGPNSTKHSESAEATAPVEGPPASGIKIDDIAAPAPSVVPASVIERARSQRPVAMPEELASFGFLYHVAIDAEGRVGEIRIAHSGPWKKLPPEADQIFRDVLRRTRFKPATLDGQPVPYHLITTIRVADIQ